MASSPTTYAQRLLDIYDAEKQLLSSNAAALLAPSVNKVTSEADEKTTFREALPAGAQEYADLLFDAGTTYGVSPIILAAIMAQESRYDPLAVNPAGTAFGLMQIHKNRWTQKWFDKLPNPNAIFDPQVNIMRGAEILAAKYVTLRTLWKQEFGDILHDARPGLAGLNLTRAALASYNAGEGNVIDKALKLGLDVDVPTDNGNYSSKVLERAAPIALKLSKNGSALALAGNALALLLMSPATYEPRNVVLAQANKGAKALDRAIAVANQFAKPADMIATAAAFKMRRFAKTSNTSVYAQQAVAAANMQQQANPGMVAGIDLDRASYDYETGLWGDGEMT